MTETELITEFMRIGEVDGKHVLEVGVLEWDSPGSARICWKTFRSWSKPPTAKHLGAAQEKALETPRFFRRCKLFQERQNAGYMMDRDTCHGCAAKHLGVVF
jgi:hypothetical protein